MKKIAPLLVLAVLVRLSAISAQDLSAIDSKIIQFEDARFDAMVRSDTALLRAMLDDDLIYIHSNGLEESKGRHLAAIGSGEMIYRSVKRLPGVRLRKYGQIALINGQVRVAGVMKGNPFEVLLKYTAVYRKKRGHWSLLNWQSTRLQTE